MGNALTSILSRILSKTRIVKAEVDSGITSITRYTASIRMASLFCIPLLQSWMAYLRSWQPTMGAILTGITRAGLGKGRSLDTVMTPKMERRYWKKSTKDRMTLLRSDARFVGTGHHAGMVPPIILSYTPALPPVKSKKQEKFKPFFTVSNKNYCKWHRMVFPPGSQNHPTKDEASKLRNEHDPDELQEIYHISCMLRDDQVFPSPAGVTKPWSPKYQKIWKEWLLSRNEGTFSFSEESDRLAFIKKPSEFKHFAQTSSSA